MRAGWLLPCTLALLATAFYGMRVCPTVSTFGDSAELGVAAVVWGVPHAPGYPLLTLIGHLFTQVPLGDVAWRLNLTSALFHGLTLFVVARTVQHWTGSPVAVVAATATLALSRTFLLGSLYYEAFPLNDLLVAAAFYLAQRATDESNTETKRRLSVVSLAAVLGAGAGHHHLLALAVPGLALLAWPVVRATPPRSFWLRCVAAGLLPLVASWLLLWVAAQRNTPINSSNIDSASSLFAHVTRQDFGGPFSSSFRPSPWWLERRQWAFWELLHGSVGLPALVAALVGGLALAVRRSVPAQALAATFVLSGPVFFGINRVGLEFEEQLAWIERFASMCHVPLALLLGLVVAHGWRWARRRSNAARMAMAGGVGVLLVIPAHGARNLDSSRDRWGDAVASDLVDRMPDGSVVLLSGDLHRNIGLFHCVARGHCGTRVVLPAHSASWYERTRRQRPELGLAPWTPTMRSGGLHLIVEQLLPNRPVFITPSLATRNPELARRYQLEADVLLFRVWPRSIDHRQAFLQSAMAATSGTCASPPMLPRELARPTMHAQELRQYSIGFENLARRGRALFGPTPLTARLIECSQRFGLPAWVSVATPGRELESVSVKSPSSPSKP